MDTSARQRGFEIRVFPLLGELPKAIEPHLPACQLYRWHLGPNMWSSPTTKSLDPIEVTALQVGFSGECYGHATCGVACNCAEPEAWTTEASCGNKLPHVLKPLSGASKGMLPMNLICADKFSFCVSKIF